MTRSQQQPNLGQAGVNTIVRPGSYEPRDMKALISFVDIGNKDKTGRKIKKGEVDYVLQQCARGKLTRYWRSILLHFQPACSGLVWMMDVQHRVGMRLVSSRIFNNMLMHEVILDRLLPVGVLWIITLRNRNNYVSCMATAKNMMEFKFAEIAEKYNKFSAWESHLEQLKRLSFHEGFYSKEVYFVQFPAESYETIRMVVKGVIDVHTEARDFDFTINFLNGDANFGFRAAVPSSQPLPENLLSIGSDLVATEAFSFATAAGYYAKSSERTNAVINYAQLPQGFASKQLIKGRIFGFKLASTQADFESHGNRWNFLGLTDPLILEGVNNAKITALRHQNQGPYINLNVEFDAVIKFEEPVLVTCKYFDNLQMQYIYESRVAKLQQSGNHENLFWGLTESVSVFNVGGLPSDSAVPNFLLIKFSSTKLFQHLQSHQPEDTASELFSVPLSENKLANLDLSATGILTGNSALRFTLILMDKRQFNFDFEASPFVVDDFFWKITKLLTLNTANM